MKVAFPSNTTKEALEQYGLLETAYILTSSERNTLSNIINAIHVFLNLLCKRVTILHALEVLKQVTTVQ